MSPFFWYMAIRACCTNTGFVRIVNSILIFQVHILFHLVAGDTKLFRIGQFHRPVKPTPEKNTEDGSTDNKRDCRKPRKPVLNTFNFIFHTHDEIYPVNNLYLDQS